MRSIKIEFSSDSSFLGDAATDEDIDRFAENIVREVSERFGVSAWSSIVNINRAMRCPDDENIHIWLQELSRSDGWTNYL